VRKKKKNPTQVNFDDERRNQRLEEKNIVTLPSPSPYLSQENSMENLRFLS
jgi:hypothetical protein